MLNRTLYLDEDSGCYFFAPAGLAPVKTERVKRLSRNFFVARKFLSKRWTKEFDQFMASDFLVIVRSQGLSDAGPALKPAAKEGELAPFLALDYDAFRKGIKQVSKATSTDVRGAAEAFLTADPEVTGQLHQRRTLERFVGHDEKTSLKHYHARASQDLSRKLHRLADQGSPKRKKGKK